METKKLSKLKVGEIGKVKFVDGEGKMRRRLFDMGITEGARILLKKKAPLGDPLEIRIRGYSLSLRLTEADLINLEMIDDKGDK